MNIRFISRDVAIATIFSTQKGVVNLPDGIHKVIVNAENGGLITTMVVVKRNKKWLITQYQHTMLAAQQGR
jgi:hypothetical protein